MEARQAGVGQTVDTASQSGYGGLKAAISAEHATPPQTRLGRGWAVCIHLAYIKFH